ncbi:MAG TPA: hypothetical protein VFF70_12980 [Anaerolineae bacterium]|nr:hypothetical protein [Anaerolineae bacterium]
MNLRFILRGSISVLALTLIVMGIGLRVTDLAFRPLDPTPPPPTILAPRGELPIDPGGLIEFARYGDSDFGVGCGFLLQLPSGSLIGVTTAHSLLFNNPASPLQRIAFGVANRSGYVAIFDTFWGMPGVARSGEDMTVDYVLLKPIDATSVDRSLVLQPDPRGAPQPGERVMLLSGLADGQGGRIIFEGTVQSVDATAVSVLMDSSFDPSGLSGSPFVSEFTGRVVGMTIATSYRANRVLLSLHPIGSIVRLAQSAIEFPKIGEYRR